MCVTSEAVLQQSAIRRCTETAASLLTEIDATYSLACIVESEGKMMRGERNSQRKREREKMGAERGVTERGRAKNKSKRQVETDAAICVCVCVCECSGLFVYVWKIE